MNTSKPAPRLTTVAAALSPPPISQSAVVAFQNKIRSFFEHNGRSMPWRSDHSPYAVFVSELMLQQTQVSRVEKYFGEFCTQYPNFHALAESELDELLILWKGLGYNRRAVFMRSTAQRIVKEHNAELPRDPEVLASFPGIGANTAGSIAAFAYNAPVVFIETNIRRVIIHEFFPSRETVHDKEILPYIDLSLDRENPRLWYWALMDYGVSLKEEGRQAARRSKHYSVQSKFEGSRRQLRSGILNHLALRSYRREGNINGEELYQNMKKALPKHPFSYQNLEDVLSQLEREAVVVCEEELLYKTYKINK